MLIQSLANVDNKLTIVTLKIKNLNLEPYTDFHMGTVKVPDGYSIISVDFIADTNGGTGWGGMTLHAYESGIIFGSTLLSIKNCNGTIKVLCSKK